MGGLFSLFFSLLGVCVCGGGEGSGRGSCQKKESFGFYFELYYRDIFSCPELLELVKAGLRLLIHDQKKSGRDYWIRVPCLNHFIRKTRIATEDVLTERWPEGPG